MHTCVHMHTCMHACTSQQTCVWGGGVTSHGSADKIATWQRKCYTKAARSLSQKLKRLASRPPAAAAGTYEYNLHVCIHIKHVCISLTFPPPPLPAPVLKEVSCSEMTAQGLLSLVCASHADLRLQIHPAQVPGLVYGLV